MMTEGEKNGLQIVSNDSSLFVIASVKSRDGAITGFVVEATICRGIPFRLLRDKVRRTEFAPTGMLTDPLTLPPI